VVLGSRLWLDARRRFLDLFLPVHEVFNDRALALRSWTFLCLPRDWAVIMLWALHRFICVDGSCCSSQTVNLT
jgi:hypothetical protein